MTEYETALGSSTSAIIRRNPAGDGSECVVAILAPLPD
jgi:hypothetical protein